MKYILNKTPIRTTEGFHINDLKIDIDIPNDFKFHDYEIENDSLVSIDKLTKQVFKTEIGLTHDEYQNLEIIIPEDAQLDYKNIIIKYVFSNNDNLVDNIVVKAKKNSKANITIIYESSDRTSSFHNGNVDIELMEGSKLKLNYINIMSKSSINIESFNIKTNQSSELKTNIFDLSGKLRVLRSDSNQYKLSSSIINNIYVGQNSDVIDINYNYINREDNSLSKIIVEGILDNNAKKSFKGNIDFVEGSTKSIGDIKENTILLSDEAISKSLPMLLCHEEDVIGSHSASSGKIDDSKVYYLMTRGFTLAEAKKMIIISRFYGIISELDEDYQKKVIDYIDNLNLNY